MDNVGMELVIQKETSPDIISIRPFSVLVFRVPENYQSKSSCRQIFFFFLSSFYTVSNCRDLPEILFLLPLSSLFIRSFHCQFSFTLSILFPYLKFSVTLLCHVEMFKNHNQTCHHVIQLTEISGIWSTVAKYIFDILRTLSSWFTKDIFIYKNINS